MIQHPATLQNRGESSLRVKQKGEGDFLYKTKDTHLEKNLIV